jgi:hypothetical protein
MFVFNCNGLSSDSASLLHDNLLESGVHIALLQECPQLAQHDMPGFQSVCTGKAGILICRDLCGDISWVRSEKHWAATYFVTGLLVVSVYMPDAWKCLDNFLDIIHELSVFLDDAWCKNPWRSIVLGGDLNCVHLGEDGVLNDRLVPLLELSERHHLS